MDTLIRKVIAKLEEKKEENKKKDKKETEEIVFKYLDKKDVSEPNYNKNMRINKDQNTELRSVYDNSPIQKLYTYGLGRFGFKYEDFRFDVKPVSLRIYKILGE